ncbi:uncharacterized protein [Diadema setosum]|uniref:uncharacterized protein n=1 Tax=Diadema setosum TaxID=31175 RepID=UPI003B3AD1EF
MTRGLSVAFKFSTTALVLAYLVPLLVIAVSIGLTLRAAAAHRRLQDSSVSHQNITLKLRFLTVVGSFSLSFMICWGYWHAYYMATWILIQNGGYYHFDVILHMALYILSNMLIFVNATLNPVLYVLTRGYLRRRVWNLLRCSSTSSTSEVANEADMLSTDVSSMMKTEMPILPAKAAGETGVLEDY